MDNLLTIRTKTEHLTVAEVQELLQSDTNMANRVISAVDMHLPELYNLMPYEENVTKESIQEAIRHRCQNLIDNPHIAACKLGQNWPKSSYNLYKRCPESYLDLLVTTLNPELNVQVPEHHLYQKCLEEINNELQDYIELINKLQRHTRYSTSYCLKVNKQTSQQSYRFGFPKKLRDQTFVQFDKHDRLELITAKNDSLINPYNQLQLQE
ncbi:hypothetical protein C2G38_2193330 [Gigaspora rosea]|uniref:Uncharacterized protein n=1 Tax=Gigaspora rosea TaxID=44941 RepID=A0A397V539_9GLOM|nr:hypothetical protein C2G38_2193330 [Gigaspora rosea]